MPRVLIDVSEAWLDRYNIGVTQCIDTLVGLEHQIDQTPTPDAQAAFRLLDHLKSQLVDLRRNVEAWRMMF